VSYDLVVIPAGRGRTADDAKSWIDRGHAGDAATDAELTALRTLASKLEEATSAGTLSPAPAATSGWVEANIPWSDLADVGPKVFALAAELGLAVFDPQAERMFAPEDERPSRDDWTRAGAPFEQVVAAIERGGPAIEDPAGALASSDPRERADAVLGYAWAADTESRDALRHILATDGSQMVRALAVQSLMLRGDVESVPAGASLIQELAHDADRESLDAALLAAGSMAQAAEHGAMGFKQPLDPRSLEDLRAAIETAASAADALRSRHRRELHAILETLPEAASGTT
jgi:hypothetical protein